MIQLSGGLEMDLLRDELLQTSWLVWSNIWIGGLHCVVWYCDSDVICKSWVDTEKGIDIQDYVVTSRYATSWSRLICREGDLLRRRVTVGLEWNTKDEAMGVGRPYKLCTYRYLWRLKIVDFYLQLSQSVTNLEKPQMYVTLLKKWTWYAYITGETFSCEFN